MKHDYDSRLSGSTCILIFCIGNKLISANAGDSRSIMIVNNNNNNKKLPIYNKNIISKIYKKIKKLKILFILI
jgi:serine/threonine protein phosphatase PrpC